MVRYIQDSSTWDADFFQCKSITEYELSKRENDTYLVFPLGVREMSLCEHEIVDDGRMETNNVDFETTNGEAGRLTVKNGK